MSEPTRIPLGPQLSHPVTRDGTPCPFFPIGDRVMVERLEPETKIGRIIIPDTAQTSAQYATVIAAGPQAQGILDDSGIAIGDTICFGKYVGVDWSWQPEGKPSIADRHKVDLVNIKDIFGSAELAKKMIDGTLGIKLYTPEGGSPEYRFFELQKEAA